MRRLTLRTNQWVDLDPAEPHDCPYLPGKTASLAPGVIIPDAATFDQLLGRGYRRLGTVFYRPACGDCHQCAPLRVPLRAFSRSRSQRRLWRRCEPIYQVAIKQPIYQTDHFEIYREHSAYVSDDNSPANPEAYRSCFVVSTVTTHFIEYRIDGELVAVSVLDEGERAVSSVYVSWKPAFARYSPGTFSALWEMDWARKRGRRYYYLGYWVEGCRPMAYKDRFRPHEVMSWTTHHWRRVTDRQQRVERRRRGTTPRG